MVYCPGPGTEFFRALLRCSEPKDQRGGMGLGGM